MYADVSPEELAVEDAVSSIGIVIIVEEVALGEAKEDENPAFDPASVGLVSMPPASNEAALISLLDAPGCPSPFVIMLDVGV